MTTTSSRFRSRRRPGIAAALLVSLCTAACSSGAAAPQPQQLTLWSGIAAGFTNDLIKRFNSALPQTHIGLQTTSGGVVVVSAVDGGQGQLGLAQSDVVYLAYRRGIERNLYPHKNLRAIAVLWVNNFYVLVRRDSPFRSIEDLKGRRVGIIRPGTSGEFSTRIVLGAHGMSYADVQPIFEPTDDLMPKLGAGEIDAVFSANPLMLAAARALSETVPLRLLPIGRTVTNQLRGSYPFLKPVTDRGQPASGAEPADRDARRGVAARVPQRSLRGSRLPVDARVLRAAAGAGARPRGSRAHRSRAGARRADPAARGRGPLLPRARGPAMIEIRRRRVTDGAVRTSPRLWRDRLAFAAATAAPSASRLS